MMMSLFSTFDPCTGIMSLNWMSTMIFIIMTSKNMWLMKNNLNSMTNKLIMKIHLEMSNLMMMKGTTLMMISLMTMIMWNNFMGLMPYIFTSPAHLTFSISLALPMWSAMMAFAMNNKLKILLAHMVPIGTPKLLLPLMVIIETISNLIRPGSLAIRLSANMIAGHLIMSLLGNNNGAEMLLLMIMFMMIILFEMAVSIIQSYVFMTLMTLYSSEI
nr:ATP synthase F0 subunit 6 [Darthula hardwickii]